MQKFRVFIFFLALMPVFCAWAGAKEHSLNYWLEKGDEYYYARQFDRAIAAYSKIIDLEPGLAEVDPRLGFSLTFYKTEVYHKRGLAYYKAGETNAAIADFSKVLSLRKEHFETNYYRGLAYAKKGHYILARDDIAKGWTHDDYVFYYDRALFYAQKDRHDLAIPYFNKVISAEGYQDMYIYPRARSYAKNGQHHLAIDAFAFLLSHKQLPVLKELAAADPAFQEDYHEVLNIYYQCALSYYELDIYDFALSGAEKILAFEPKHPDALNLKNKILAFDVSVEAAANAAPTEPPTAEVYFQRGKAYQKKGRYNLALANYNQAVALDPQYAEAYFQRGMIYLTQYNLDNISIYYQNPLMPEVKPRARELYELAFDDFNKTIALNPQHAQAYYNRGRIYYGRKQQFEAATADISQALQLEPEFEAGYSMRGRYYYEQRKYDLAVADFTKAIKLNPKNPVNYEGRGNAYDYSGQTDLAIADYTKALQLEPRSTSAYYNRGIAYFTKGDYSAAADDFSEFREWDTNNTSVYGALGAIFLKLTLLPDPNAAEKDTL
ncbi:MAG: tetratricopeptide repeat protein [Sporomusaceae bacterium]|nr:tetratricopeptide repeat protein [Sporomusaceae bacterium]